MNYRSCFRGFSGFLTFLFFLIFHSDLNAQSREFQYGLNLGVSLTQIDGDNLSGYDKFGPHVGVFVERQLKKKFGLRAEFLFTVKGAKNYVDKNNITDPLKAALYYMEVPIIATYSIKKLKIEAGPSFGVLMWAYNSNNSGNFLTNTRDYNRMEWAMHWGGSYLVKKNLTVYARFSYSVLNIDGGPHGRLLSSPRLRTGYYNNVLSFGIRRYFGT
ncbi:MAG: outer membrane beta-barrel protein [Bacteroidetes bacterium]|nr:outer membrane beta-barrel protein [Bacteroidota bacterium]